MLQKLRREIETLYTFMCASPFITRIHSKEDVLKSGDEKFEVNPDRNKTFDEYIRNLNQFMKILFQNTMNAGPLIVRKIW